MNISVLQDYRNVDQVRIYSKAKIVIDPVLNIQQTNLKNDVDSVSITPVMEFSLIRLLKAFQRSRKCDRKHVICVKYKFGW